MGKGSTLLLPYLRPLFLRNKQFTIYWLLFHEPFVCCIPGAEKHRALLYSCCSCQLFSRSVWAVSLLDFLQCPNAVVVNYPELLVFAASTGEEVPVPLTSCDPFTEFSIVPLTFPLNFSLKEDVIVLIKQNSSLILQTLSLHTLCSYLI